MPENSPKETESSSEEKIEIGEAKQEKETKKQEKKSLVRIITLFVFLLCIFFFIWYVVSDRHTPYTDQARLTALVVPIVPQVSGYLKEENVNQAENLSTFKYFRYIIICKI